MIEQRIECLQEGFENELKFLQRIDPIKIGPEEFKEAKQYVDNIKKRIKAKKSKATILLKNLETIENNENIAFSSLNYDTYISKVEIDGNEFLYVATCNNIQWNLWDYSTIPQSLNKGDIYDGLYDHDYVEHCEFLVLDYMKKIKIVYDSKTEEPGTHYIYGSLKDTFEPKKTKIFGNKDDKKINYAL